MKKYIIGFLTGAIVFGCLGVYAYSIASKDVEYDNTTSNLESTNVQGAIDELYELSANGNIKEMLMSYSGYVSFYKGDGTNIMKDVNIYVNNPSEGEYIRQTSDFKLYALKPGNYIVGLMVNDRSNYASTTLVTVTENDTLPYLLSSGCGGAMTVIAY